MLGRLPTATQSRTMVPPRIIRTMSDLILIPTELERGILRRWLHDSYHRVDCNEVACRPLEPTTDALDRCEVELCGFGLIAAAARTMQLIAQRNPQRIILVGIAGALGAAVEVGSAIEFGAVTVDGIGVGCGESYRSATAIGWSHWVDYPSGQTIGDTIDLVAGGRPMLLSVGAASSDIGHADQRRQRYPAAIAEDMEGFGVALACQLMRVPLRIVRGISNVAGDRNFSQWQIETALQQAAQHVAGIRAEPWETNR